jgi:CRISPR-associated protein Cas1
MTTLYIDRKGAELDHEAGAVVVRVNGERIATLPLGPAERMIVRGAARIACPLLAAAWSRGITLVLLGGRMGEIAAMQHGPAHADARIRLLQYRLALDPAGRSARAQRLVLAKVSTQRLLLRRALMSRADARGALLDAIATVEGVRRRLQRGEGDSLGALMGLEGAAAAAHFAGLAALFPPSLGFTERNRRPPRDPVNACLSLGYTLLHAEAVRAAHRAGLDPLIGFFHQPAPGRESLACDLVEPLRPKIDEWVWELFRARTLRDAHFASADGACLLGKTGRQHFYAGYETIAPPMRGWLRRSCAMLVRSLREQPGLTA